MDPKAMRMAVEQRNADRLTKTLARTKLARTVSTGSIVRPGALGGPVGALTQLTIGRLPKYRYDHRWGGCVARTVHGHDGTTKAILASGIVDQRLLRQDMDTARVVAGRETLRTDVKQQTVTDDERAGCEVTRLGFAHETQRYPALAATVTAGRLPSINHPFARHPFPKPTTKAHHNISSTVGSARLGALPPTLASPNNQYFFTTQTNLSFSSARGYIATI